jgi:glutamate-ammonia-ligase adenylyltransferase
VHAARAPQLIDTNTGRVLAAAQSLGLLDTADGELLRAAWQLHHDLSQILRLCLSQPFDPERAGPGLLSLLARTAGLPDFARLDAHLRETQGRAREVFERILK